jgi:signal transduction histidine kinase
LSGVGDDARDSASSASSDPGSRLLATMVHDLRNPLSALAGNLALLKEELATVPLQPTGSRCLEDSLALCTRALLMVQSIADVDALEQGTITVRPRITPLRPEVEVAVVQGKVDAEARDLVIHIDVPELSPVVDGRLLSRVIQNLHDNAVRYAPRGGRVEIKVAMADRQLVITVGNSGPALTGEEKTAIFERDYRAAQRQAGARMGRDFGLYFCRLVVEAHKGTITVEEHEGLPAVFVVRIPQ